MTPAKLHMIERAEHALNGLGFRVCRVRHHELQGPSENPLNAYLASVEIGRDDLTRALEPTVRDQIISAVRAVGYRQVTIDPKGYRMGSLNEGVQLTVV